MLSFQSGRPNRFCVSQANSGTQMWFRTYMWGIIYLRYESLLFLMYVVVYRSEINQSRRVHFVTSNLRTFGLVDGAYGTKVQAHAFFFLQAN